MVKIIRLEIQALLNNYLTAYTDCNTSHCTLQLHRIVLHLDNRIPYAAYDPLAQIPIYNSFFIPKLMVTNEIIDQVPETLEL